MTIEQFVEKMYDSLGNFEEFVKDDGGETFPSNLDENEWFEQFAAFTEE